MVGLLKLKGIIKGNDISIAICLRIEENHIDVNLANQLLAPKPNIKLGTYSYQLMVINLHPNLMLQLYI